MITYAWYFFIYSFVGWCAEVAFAAVKNGRFVNRGFLNGPLCPIYGSGIVGVLLVLQPYQNQLAVLYFGSVALSTLIELFTGFLLEKLFHQRWWDYSKMPLNIGGYVCVLFSLLWGVACVLIVDVIHPRVATVVALIPELWSVVFLSVLGGVFLTDVIVTVATVAKLNRRLTQIDDLSAALRLTSERLGVTVADSALAMKAKDDQACENLLSARERAQKAVLEADERTRAELDARHAELVQRLGHGQRRLLEAFPAIRSLRHPSALATLQQALHERLEHKRRRH